MTAVKGWMCFRTRRHLLFSTIALLVFVIVTVSFNNSWDAQFVFPQFPYAAQRDTTWRRQSSCSMDECFDITSSGCSLSAGFPVFFHHVHIVSSLRENAETPLSKEINGVFTSSRSRTENSKDACMFLVTVEAEPNHEDLSVINRQLEAYLTSVATPRSKWRNHVVVNLSPDKIHLNDTQADQAVIASSSFSSAAFRTDYDIIIPSFPSDVTESKDFWRKLPHVDPAFRKFLFSLKLACGDTKDFEEKEPLISCGRTLEQEYVLTESTFSVLIAPAVESKFSTAAFQRRLSEALKSGAVPVILGSSVNRRLPFSELIRWEEAVLTLPFGRSKDLTTILSSFRSSDITQMRLRGRFLWENYFSSARNIIEATLAVMRKRLRIPPLPAKEEKSVLLYNSAGANQQTSPSPLRRIPSEAFQRNYSTTMFTSTFNQPGDPFSLFPSTPYEPTISTAAKWWGPEVYHLGPLGANTLRPQAQFNYTLLGNRPQEQFTVVILTYKRVTSLIALLKRLKGLPFLNKVIVVWNDPTPPAATIQWPDIGVPVQVLKSPANSLNNRFLPFDAIETDAIFSMDDDVDVAQDKIVLGFKIWRENRDRIVGFFWRYHTWNEETKTWEYTGKGYRGEVSLAITSATFYHKYYNYLYSYVMPQAIRDHVTSRMNCEDVAMNFLVAHVTRKPPIRVNWKWKYSVCGGPCGGSISGNSDHLKERHECMELFAKIYGYMPLLDLSYATDFQPDYH